MNWKIFFVTVWFFILENQYFGWNLIAQSDAELIADGIILLMLCLSLLDVNKTIKINIM